MASIVFIKLVLAIHGDFPVFKPDNLHCSYVVSLPPEPLPKALLKKEHYLKCGESNAHINTTYW